MHRIDACLATYYSEYEFGDANAKISLCQPAEGLFGESWWGSSPL